VTVGFYDYLSESLGLDEDAATKWQNPSVPQQDYRSDAMEPEDKATMAFDSGEMASVKQVSFTLLEWAQLIAAAEHALRMNQFKNQKLSKVLSDLYEQLGQQAPDHDKF
jgi:hypothetical protein